MTCIIGMADKKRGKVWIGGDSVGVDDWGTASPKRFAVRIPTLCLHLGFYLLCSIILTQ